MQNRAVQGADGRIVCNRAVQGADLDVDSTGFQAKTFQEADCMEK